MSAYYAISNYMNTKLNIMFQPSVCGIKFSGSRFKEPPYKHYNAKTFNCLDSEPTKPFETA